MINRIYMYIMCFHLEITSNSSKAWSYCKINTSIKKDALCYKTAELQVNSYYFWNNFSFMTLIPTAYII